MLLLKVLVLALSSTMIKAEVTMTDKSDDTITHQSDNVESSTLPTPITSADEFPNPGFSPKNPPYNPPDMPHPNIFHNLFNHFFKPSKVSSKTYGPSIIAIVGDKPYISLEVFNKLSPFKWLINAFQGKIQNLCGFLAPPQQDENPELNPQDLLNQILQGNHQNPSGSTVLGSGQIKIYDIPANGIRKKLSHQQ